MSDLIKASFLLGVIANFLAIPLQVAALLLMWLPFDHYILNVARCTGIGLSMILGPILIGACTMKHHFTVANFENINPAEEKRERAPSFAPKLSRLNQAYEAFWTSDNRIACALLSGMTLVFALSRVQTSFVKEVAVLLTAFMMLMTFVTIVVLTLNYHNNQSLKKANV